MNDHSLFREASSIETSPFRLDELSKHHSEVIRGAVAANKSTENDTLLSLVGDTSSHVIENLHQTKNKFCEKKYDFSKTKNTKLSLVDVADSEFILSLRVDSTRNQYISHVDSSLAIQQEWIKKYKQRETLRSEFYFIIKDNQDQSLGTVRLYDFQKGSFCWGSWIVSPHAPKTTAIESALNVYEFAFGKLGFERSHFDVRNNNSKVIQFHKRMGAIELNSNELDTFFTMENDAYNERKIKYKKFFRTHTAT